MGMNFNCSTEKIYYQNCTIEPPAQLYNHSLLFDAQPAHTGIMLA